MKRYNEFINEGLLSAMKPKSMEDMLVTLKALPRVERIIKIITYQFPFELLPEGELIIPHDLDLPQSEIYKLPDNLTIDGYLYCEDNELTTLPKNLKVLGNLNLNHNHIKTLPDNLTVGGYLWCDYNQLDELPKNLTVGGGFTCMYNNLTSLPQDISIKKYFYCSFNAVVLERPVSYKVGDFFN